MDDIRFTTTTAPVEPAQQTTVEPVTRRTKTAPMRITTLEMPARPSKPSPAATTLEMPASPPR